MISEPLALSPRVPYRVGRMGCERKKLLNTYFLTESGGLIPDSFFFFNDTFRTVTGIRSLANAARDDTYHFSKRELERHVRDGRLVLDELLAIADPKRSHGLARRPYQGFFLPETLPFFSGIVVDDLLRRLERPQFDFAQGCLSDHFFRLEERWSGLKTACTDYEKTLFAEQGSVHVEPRTLDAFGVRYIK